MELKKFKESLKELSNIELLVRYSKACQDYQKNFLSTKWVAENGEFYKAIETEALNRMESGGITND